MTMRARDTTSPVKPPASVALDTCVLSAKTRHHRFRRTLQVRRYDGCRTLHVTPHRPSYSFATRTDGRRRVGDQPNPHSDVPS